MKDYLENATGPIIIHRLDMATSGILLVAKSEEIYKTMQSQFMNREIEKTYEAIISGKVIGETGRINLPMRKDILDRPRQMVCHSQGKETISDWKVIERKGNETRVEFYPRTGRTHQLRVHAAHSEGLGFPIKGDDLYGVPTDRLYLHASKIRFKHPRSGKPIMIELTAPY